MLLPSVHITVDPCKILFSCHPQSSKKVIHKVVGYINSIATQNTTCHHHQSCSNTVFLHTVPSVSTVHVWPGILGDWRQGNRTPCKNPTTYNWGVRGGTGASNSQFTPRSSRNVASHAISITSLAFYSFQCI